MRYAAWGDDRRPRTSMGQSAKLITELTAASVALARIASLVEDGRDAFDSSQDRQLALVFCWVNVGSLLKQYVRLTKPDLVGGVLSAPTKMRDKRVYGSLLNLRADVVWDTCVVDAPAAPSID